MCECGCSSSYHTFSLPGPKGITYVLEFGDGCEDCGTPAGVIVSASKTKDLSAMYGGEIPSVLPMRDYSGRREAAIGIADPGKFHEFVVSEISRAFGVVDDLHWPGGFELDPEEFKREIYGMVSANLLESIRATTGSRQPDGGDRR